MKLYYFDAAVRAEPIRICLHIAGADWTDIRFKRPDWPTIKPTTPLGSVPVLKMDGEDYCQSGPLLRYAGKLAGWYPSDPVEALVADQVVDSMNELMAKAPSNRVYTVPEKLEKVRKEFQANVMPKYAGWVEGIIEKNGGTFVTGNQPSIADLFLMAQIKMWRDGTFDYIDPNFFDAYPGITNAVKITREHEQVDSYYKSLN